MAVDTPATICVLGAGPIGMEVGLYARYLGYEVILFEQHDVATHVRAWGHVRMFSPFAELRSTLGLAALKAQDAAYRPLELDARLTGRQWVDDYLLPLSQTDLLADGIRTHCRVVAVGRRQLLKCDRVPHADRAADGFRILAESADGSLCQETADVVIDCTGVYGQPMWCGAGGIPARGERRVHDRIEYGVPDILGARRGEYEGRHTLVVGGELTAAAAVVALLKLAERAPGTHVTWAIHRHAAPETAGPLPLAVYDHVPERQRLARAANAHVQDGTAELDFRPGTVLHAIDYDPEQDQFLVWFAVDAGPERFDRVVANVGHRPDRSLYDELCVAESPITEGPAGIAENLAGEVGAVGPAASQPLPARLLTQEPNFYVLGAKSFGRDARFLMTDGYRQIRDLFGIIGGRAGLDLYAAAEGLAK